MKRTEVYRLPMHTRVKLTPTGKWYEIVAEVRKINDIYLQDDAGHETIVDADTSVYYIEKGE